MQRLLTSLGALGSGLLLAVACSEERPANFFPGPDGGVQAGFSGAGGSGAGAAGGAGGGGGSLTGTGGNAGGGGAAGDGMPAGSGGQAPDAGGGTGSCSVDADCSDQNTCTTESCQAGSCVDGGFAASGTQCGSATDDACTDPDSCDGSGVCQPNNAPAAAGMPCGSATDDECTNPDTCDAEGVCQPNDEPLDTPCGSSTDDECTDPDVCDDFGQCSPNNAAAGTFCGSATDDACTDRDLCGNGVCLPRDEANGAACAGGSCTTGQCIAGQPEGCPVDVVNSVPASINWSSVGRPDLFGGSCDSSNMPDYALVFTAPQAGIFRFTAIALVDSTPYTGAGDPSGIPAGPPDGDAVLTVAEGSCAGPASAEVACNDDLVSGNLNSQLELQLADQEVITVYLNELTQTGGGTGTLSITLQP